MFWRKDAREFNREIATNDVFTSLKTILETQEFLMSAIDDLSAAVTAAVAAIQSLEIQLAAAKAAAGNGVTDTQLEGLASQLNAATATTQPAPTAPTEPAQGTAPASA